MINFTNKAGRGVAMLTLLGSSMFSVGLLPVSQAHAQGTEQNRCIDAVQGKVAWDRAGSKAWNESNVLKLCSGSKNHQATIKCFSDKINKGVSWSPAIDACRENIVDFGPHQKYSWVEKDIMRYKLIVDCHGSNLDNTTSKDRVDVEFVFADGKVHKTSTSKTFVGLQDNRPVCSGSTDAWYISQWLKNPGPKVTEVKLTTSGSDALWIDQLRLELHGGTQKCEETKGITNFEKCYDRKEKIISFNTVQSWGVANGSGYCLSKQSNDAGGFNGKVFRNNCFETLTFSSKDPNAVSGNLTASTTPRLTAKDEAEAQAEEQGAASLDRQPAKIFGGCNYAGWQVDLEYGQNSYNTLGRKGFKQDEVSSIQLKPGYYITLFDGPNLNGASLTLQHGDPRLKCLWPGEWNDRAGSFRIGKN